MKFLRVIAPLLALVSLSSLSSVHAAGEAIPQYEPRLADIMSTTQLRHMKLWFAGASPNWDLAAYELRQLKAGLVEAALLYPGIPISNVTTMAAPIQAIADAIDEKSTRKFADSFTKLTSGCNACHQSVGLGFLVMRVPTASPFSDQVFPPKP